ncbi:hypothetical protein ACQPUY_08950 [Clostridium nigeriense]|uniref:hypothetical protein n=1 Tax=Clostridium nigeriense TaxID=1805470 RepID=UPI003D34D974
MDKNFFTYVKEHKNIVIASLLLLFILSFSLFFITYNSKDNRTKRYLKNLAEELNDVNSTLTNGVKDLTIDTNNTKDILSTGIENLNKIIISVSEVNSESSDVSSLKENLTNALNSTINLYDNSLIILSNPENVKNNDDLNKFNTFKENCILDYSKLVDNNIKISFSDDSLKFIDNFNNYMNTLIKINRDSEFKNSQQKDFIYTLESFNDDITYLNEDLTLAINKIREDKRDFQGIIDDIYNKEDTFNNLKNKLAFLSIPEGCMEIYESLNEYLNTYSAYLNTIKEAVIYEKTSSDVDDASEKITKNYKNSTSKRNDVLKAYSSYENKLKNF